MSSHNLNINEDVKQVLLGTLFGDASLPKTSKNASYSYVHSPKQKDYLFWVADLLKKNFQIKTTLRQNGDFQLYHLWTNCSPILTYLHSLYYIKSSKPKRKWEKMVNLSILKELSPLALAVWYCDDGTYYIRDKSCGLSTQGFTLEENKLIQDYFLKKWEIKATVIPDYRSDIKKMYYKIVFNKKEAEKFLFLIKSYVPKSMIYKLGHISEKNKNIMENEDKRYKSLNRLWYYKNHERALGRALRYREGHRKIINTKRVEYYWQNPEKSRISGKETMRKRRLLQREMVNLINKNYYRRNKDRINKARRERLKKDSKYRERRNKQQREWYCGRKLTKVV